MGETWGSVALPAALCIATLVLLASRRVRADGVAVLALVAAVLLGIVPPDQALSGLADPVVVTVLALAILAGAVHRSGVVDLPRTALARRFRLTTPVLMACGVLVALLAALSGRVGTRAAIQPAALSSQVVPGAFGSHKLLLLNVACLLGGLMTVVGGVPNLLVSAIRREMIGAEFNVLDFLPLGGTLLCCGLLAFGLAAAVTRRAEGVAQRGPGDSLRRVRGFTGEALVPAASPLAGRTVSELEANGSVRVLAVVRESYRRILPQAHWVLESGDVLVLDCEPPVLQGLMERYSLQPSDGPIGRPGSLASVGIVEAVVTQSSDLIGHSPRASGLHDRFGVHLLAVGRNDDHPPGRLRRTPLHAGDILVLGGELDAMPATLASLGCLLLAERRLRVGLRLQITLPIATLLVVLGGAATGFVPLWVGVLVGVLLLVLSRVLSLQEVYEASPWPGVVMLASLLPLAAALHGSAAAAVAARAVATYAVELDPVAATAAAVAATMAATWLFGSTVAVLLVAPFAVAVSLGAGLPPDMLLAAVVVGAAVDMLDARGLLATLVPGLGFRSGSGWRASLAVGCLLLVFGTAAVMTVWGA